VLEGVSHYSDDMTHDGMMNSSEALRWVNHAGHSALAMSWEGTVEPDGISVVDCYSEDI
jgi:hypothetical protein